jgi:hypothetical protein
MPDESVAAAVRERANVIGKLQAYIGLFEWCALAVSRQRPVLLWFGDEPVDVLQVFCPTRADAMVYDQQPLNIIASVVDEGLTLMAQGEMPFINHYLAAVSMADLVSDHQERAAKTRSVMIAAIKKAAKSISKPVSNGTAYIADAYRQLGLIVIPTASQGDCGPDAACCLEVRDQTPAGWKAWREELRAFILEWSHSDDCQECFKSCQEFAKAHPRPARKLAVVDRVEDDDKALGASPSAEEVIPGIEDRHDDDNDDALAEEMAEDSEDESSEHGWEKLSEPGDVKATIEKLLGSSVDEASWGKVDQFRRCRDAAVRRVSLLDGGKQKPNTKRRLQARMKLSERIEIGERYLAFQREARSQHRKKFLKDFISDVLGWTPSQRNKDFVVRCSKAAIFDGASGMGTSLATYPDRLAAVTGRVQGLVHHASRRGTKRRRDRYVSLTFQGRPALAPVLSELLFEWFVDIRGTVKGRLPVKAVLIKARQLVVEYFKTCVGKNEVPRLPAITKQWVYRWKRRHAVSFRKPNQRYKVSKQGIMFRLRVFWLNNIRVRYFSIRLSEHKRKIAEEHEREIAEQQGSAPTTALRAQVPDPSGDIGLEVDMADQKPWYFNQSGSKLLPTLHFQGAQKVTLKENHAATRMRSTMFTWTSTVKEMLSKHMGKCKLPFEFCFKFSGPGERVIAGLELPDGAYSVRGTASGSYKEVHVFLFLEEHLPKATEERRRTGNWRLLYLDLYAGHLSRRIWDLCWSRLYVLLYHGGGCTGLTQWNDVWLHWLLEQRLLDVEQVHFTSEMLIRPDKVPSMDRQAYIDNAAAVWESLPHERSLEWSKRTGVSIALDGSEDIRGKYCTVRPTP